MNRLNYRATKTAICNLAIRDYYNLTKPGIVKLVLITGLAGYGLGYRVESRFIWSHFIFFLIGLGMISAGSLALNQVQEWREDARMARTSNRPIPLGLIKPIHGFVFSLVLCLGGLSILYMVQPITMFLGVHTILFYNILYTIFFKKKFAFAAVPGALPGAAPAVLGYSAANPNIFNTEVAYIFLLMFLWQMPHFWALAIRYADDYVQGGFPVLPTQLGEKRTKIHMGLYMLPYVILAIVSPLFVEIHYFYFCFVIPISMVLIYEFYRFCFSQDQKSWLRFFIWINISILIFLIAPVIDKWSYYFLKVAQYG